jgi:hypothetical protein
LRSSDPKKLRRNTEDSKVSPTNQQILVETINVHKFDQDNKKNEVARSKI